MTWDDFERMLCWMILQGIRPRDWARGFSCAEWSLWAPVRDAYESRWPRDR